VPDWLWPLSIAEHESADEQRSVRSERRRGILAASRLPGQSLGAAAVGLSFTAPDRGITIVIWFGAIICKLPALPSGVAAFTESTRPE
jgi:hypothetical protein